MEKENNATSEFIRFVKDNNMDDIFVDYNWFHENFGCNLYDYIRVSTEKQEFGRQIIETYNFAKKENIKIYINHVFCDKYTGKRLDRKGYQTIKSLIKQNDYLMASELNRLGRDWDNTCEEWDWCQKNDIRVIIQDNKLLSAKYPFEEQSIQTLDYKFIQAIMFNAINYVASKKIEEISKATKDGLKKARLEGKQLGKPKGKYSTTDNFIKTLKLQIEDGYTMEKALKKTHLPKSTYTQWLKNYKKEFNVNETKDVYNLLKIDYNLK